MTKVFFSPEPLIFTVGGGEPGLSMDTIGNFAHAIDVGSDVILTNVSFTADKKIVLHSSEVYLDSLIQAGGVESRTLRELTDIFSGSIRHDQKGPEGSLFPELKLALEAFPSQKFHFILNGSGTGFADVFIETVLLMNAAERILVSAGGRILKRIRDRKPDIATTFTFMGVLGFYALCKTGLISLRKHFNDDALMLTETIGASYIANPGVIEAAKERDIRVYLLNVDDESTTRRFLQSGAHGVVTGNVPLIKGVLDGA